MRKDLSDKDLLVNGIPFADKDTISISCREILENPAYETSTSKMYSYDQMLEMFTSGSTYIVSETNRAFENYKNGLAKPFRELKLMNVGDVKVFPMEKWNATRSAASTLRRQYGCLFTVNKHSISDTRFEVVVTRKF